MPVIEDQEAAILPAINVVEMEDVFVREEEKTTYGSTT
jgi:hypothetical protein